MQEIIPLVIDLGSVHIMPEEFENTALFLRLGVPFTLVQLQNRALQRGSLEGLKTPAFHCCVDGIHFENRAFRK